MSKLMNTFKALGKVQKISKNSFNSTSFGHRADNDIRCYSSSRGKLSVPQASFTWETLFDGRNIEILRNKQPNLNLNLGSGVAQEIIKPKDETATVYLEKIPRGFLENKKEATKRNLVAYYGKKEELVFINYGTSNREITVDFHPRTFTGEFSDDEEVKRYHDEKKSQFFDSRGLWGYYFNVKLSPLATAHFAERGVAFGVGRFFGEINPDNNAGAAVGVFNGYYMLILKTKGGMWEICWHSSELDLETNKTFFFDIVKNIRIRYPNDINVTQPERPKELSAANTPSTNSNTTSTSTSTLAPTLTSTLTSTSTPSSTPSSSTSSTSSNDPFNLQDISSLTALGIHPELAEAIKAITKQIMDQTKKDS